MSRIGRAWLVPAATFLLAACSGGTQGEVDAASAEANPCAANPCAANPCAAMPQELPVDKIRQGEKKLNMGGKSAAELAAMGKQLWADASLSGTGATSCRTCHSGDGYAMMNETFAQPYPHAVAMAKDRAGFDKVTAAEMVQLCMAIPMSAQPLAYDDVRLAALTAHVKELQKGYSGAAKAGAAPNPCAANPCAPNPCAANPCAANPCGQ